MKHLLRLALLAALLLATVAPPAAAQRRGPQDLDPAEYASPSGRYVLRVDPTGRDGTGPADCRLAHDGEEVWARPLPFTFREAVVADDGLACGYAYTKGYGGIEGGELVLAMVDAGGEVVMREARAREPSFLHSPDAPRCAGVHLLPQARQVIARVCPDSSKSSETWWVFDLERRVRVCTVAMESTVAGGDDFYGTLALRPVAGTPLVLAHWKRAYGTGFTLFDDDFDPVWGLSLPSDYRAVENRDDRRLWETMHGGAGIPLSAPGTFAVWRFADRELVTYSVDPDGARWDIEELERQPRGWEELTEPESPPTITLEPLGEILLRVDPGAAVEREEGVVDHVAGARAAPERIHEPVEARCGLDGRLYVLDGCTAIVHVFDRAGEPLHRCVPEPNDYPGPPSIPHMAVDSGGRVFVSRDVYTSVYVRYNHEGARVAIEEFRGTDLTFLAGSSEPWVAEYNSAARLAPDGSVTFTLERHADRTWIDSVVAIAAASDGALLVYDGRLTIRDPNGGLCTLDAGPARARYVVELVRGVEMVRGGGWVARLSLESEVHLVREEDGAAFLFDLSDIHEEAWFDLATPPDGSELWLFDRERRAFLRYAWPED